MSTALLSAHVGTQAPTAAKACRKHHFGSPEVLTRHKRGKIVLKVAY